MAFKFSTVLITLKELRSFILFISFILFSFIKTYADQNRETQFYQNIDYFGKTVFLSFGFLCFCIFLGFRFSFFC